MSKVTAKVSDQYIEPIDHYSKQTPPELIKLAWNDESQKRVDQEIKSRETIRTLIFKRNKTDEDFRKLIDACNTLSTRADFDTGCTPAIEYEMKYLKNPKIYQFPPSGSLFVLAKALLDGNSTTPTRRDAQLAESLIYAYVVKMKNYSKEGVTNTYIELALRDIKSSQNLKGVFKLLIIALYYQDRLDEAATLLDEYDQRYGKYYVFDHLNLAEDMYIPRLAIVVEAIREKQYYVNKTEYNYESDSLSQFVKDILIAGAIIYGASKIFGGSKEEKSEDKPKASVSSKSSGKVSPTTVFTEQNEDTAKQWLQNNLCKLAENRNYRGTGNLACGEIENFNISSVSSDGNIHRLLISFKVKYSNFFIPQRNCYTGRLTMRKYPNGTLEYLSAHLECSGTTGFELCSCD